MSSIETVAAKAIETTTFKVIIARHSNSDVLLVHNGHNLTLPTVTIPKWTRFTPEIAECVLRQSGLRTISLFHPETQNTAGEPDDQYVILEPRDSSWQPPAGFRWVLRDGFRNSFSSEREAQSLETALAIADAYNSGRLHGPFARAGWFDDLVSWAQRQLDPHGLTITGEFRQLNCGPTFSLVRLETDGPAVWFKAVGEPNLREFRITETLANHFPSYLPTLIATQPFCNGWLTFEVDGAMMDENSDISQWGKAGETVANLQIESIKRTPDLLSASCQDLRMPTLLNQIEPFFDVVAELMTKQSKVPPPVLSRYEIHVLGTQIREAGLRLQELRIPDTLGHLDFNLSNIIVGPERCVFLDWAEACVGHPFLTFEYLRGNLARVHPGNEAGRSTVTSSYLRPWRSLIPVETLSQALELTPLLAVYAYAIGIRAYRDSKQLENLRLAGFLRALTRRMQREAGQIPVESGHA